jgi:hypothetical protein
MEGRHRPPAGSGPGWAEVWSFDFCAPDASIAGLARLALVPGRRVAEYWAVLVGDGRPVLLVRDPEVPFPPTLAGLAVRSEGLWSDLVCEEPLSHWSVGLEAFAVGFDDPLEAIGAERGDRVGLGFDLEWESVAAAETIPFGYRQPCFVSGELLVGDERLLGEWWGYRSHLWGVDPWLGGLCGRLDDGTWVTDSEDIEVVERHPIPVRVEAARTEPAVWWQAACTLRGAGGQTGAGWRYYPTA